MTPAPGHSRLSVAVGVALLAAVSTLVGHGVIFMLNRVRGVRFAVSLALGAVYLVVLQAFTGLVVGLASYLFVRDVSVRTIAVVYLLSLAPRAFGFLVFIPYLGLGIGRVIEGWCLLTLFVTLAVELQIGPWRALLVGGTAWLLTQVLSRLLARLRRPVALGAAVVLARGRGRGPDHPDLRRPDAAHRHAGLLRPAPLAAGRPELPRGDRRHVPADPERRGQSIWLGSLIRVGLA